MFIATEFTEPLSDYDFFYDPCTNETFGGGLKEIPDPYEMKTVKISKSIVENSGEGVIMERDIPKDRVACFYSLYLYKYVFYIFECLSVIFIVFEFNWD